MGEFMNIAVWWSGLRAIFLILLDSVVSNLCALAHLTQSRKVAETQRRRSVAHDYYNVWVGYCYRPQKTLEPAIFLGTS